ncbi:MAG: hypothetical protein AB7F43_09150 [Bacteriovoracia bacterium]
MTFFFCAIISILFVLNISRADPAKGELKKEIQTVITQGSRELKHDVIRGSAGVFRNDTQNRQRHVRQNERNISKIQNEARDMRTGPTAQGSFRARDTARMPSRHPPLSDGQKPMPPPPPPPGP